VNLFYVLALGGDWNSLAWQGWQPDFKLRGNTINPLNAKLKPICHLLILLGDLMFMGPCIVKYIPIYIQQDATLHSLFISGNCSTCFWNRFEYATHSTPKPVPVLPR
jgi:hypothetical protein